MALVHIARDATPSPVGNEERIDVLPEEGGWSVRSSFTGAPLMFLSGAKAEAQAKVLAELLAKSGHNVRLAIHDRSQIAIGTWRYFGGGD